MAIVSQDSQAGGAPPESDQQITQRVIAAFDAKAETWAAKLDMRHVIRGMLAMPDREDRLVQFIKDAYADGLCQGALAPHEVGI